MQYFYCACVLTKAHPMRCGVEFSMWWCHVGIQKAVDLTAFWISNSGIGDV